MDVYKLRPEHVGGHRIEREKFEADTQRQKPWYQIGASGRSSQFAVCPACDNPVQLIGLYELPANVRQPFGKHAVKSVEGLGLVDSEARENCPYFKPRQHEKAARKVRFDGTPRKIVQLLIEQFDRVVYLLQKQTGVTLSQNALKGMLRRYKGERGFMYTGATLRNVPWIFAYMSDATDLFGQRLIAPLQEVILASVPGADISADGRVVSQLLPDGTKAPFFDLKHCFIHHRVSKTDDDGGLSETMTMVFSLRERQDIREIYRQVLEFDYEEFERLIRIPEGRGTRRMELVSLANEMLGELLR
ncbi:hypothetical protein BVH03_17655 [Pseudomonas sp. PA15(2017)]|uniref:hypothetical protein n=1 Tax=Pseudomonas sp. PA15(2017) TaxID=1932111 RepID=UPI00095ACD5F|nr:hypothetical protein [Pseudomonas sp. PA15(2017)]OLU25480.1 hypothetical protein BVH03_17655 [Pseudomonas sp. PA15(2017)]